jgi:hypothetical protein
MVFRDQLPSSRSLSARKMRSSTCVFDSTTYRFAGLTARPYRSKSLRPPAVAGGTVFMPEIAGRKATASFPAGQPAATPDPPPIACRRRTINGVIRRGRRALDSPFAEKRKQEPPPRPTLLPLVAWRRMGIQQPPRRAMLRAGPVPTMAAFDDLDWTRFDVWAAVALEGVAVVETSQRDACHTWLRQHDHALNSIDFAQGIGPAVVAMGELFRWEEQFGYRLTPEKRNLDALRDGFEVRLKPGQGHALEFLNAEVAHRENPRWLRGLLAIAHEHSRFQLALSARFFAMLVLDRRSPLIGVGYETLSVPVPFSTGARHGDPFRTTGPAS